MNYEWISCTLLVATFLVAYDISRGNRLAADRAEDQRRAIISQLERIASKQDLQSEQIHKISTAIRGEAKPSDWWMATADDDETDELDDEKL
jgi:hypothetical protein